MVCAKARPCICKHMLRARETRNRSLTIPMCQREASLCRRREIGGRWDAPEETVLLRVASTVSCTAAVQVYAPLLVVYTAPCSHTSSAAISKQQRLFTCFTLLFLPNHLVPDVYRGTRHS